MDKQKAAAALMQFRKARSALAEMPRDPDCVLVFAQALEELGRLEDALLAYRQARMLAGLNDGLPADCAVVRLCCHLGFWQDAFETASAVLNSAPKKHLDYDPILYARLFSYRGAASLLLGESMAAARDFFCAETLAAAAGQASLAAQNASSYLASLAYLESLPTTAQFHAHQWRAMLHWPDLTHRLDQSGNQELKQEYRARKKIATRLRIGYVSADFRDHAVAAVIAPILQGHDRKSVKLFAYASVGRPDSVTASLAEWVEVWRNIEGLEDEQAAVLIRQDRLDVAIDLSGHMHGNRLGLFAYRIAPVQASWIGYVTTTGLKNMDLRITDAYLTPPEGCESFTEQLLVLPRPSLAYRPPQAAPPVQPGPALSKISGRNLSFSFGCFNNAAKISLRCLAVWAKIMEAVPNSRLVLKSSAPMDTASRARLLERFHRAGFAAARVDFLAWRALEQDHLAAYEHVDVALDPFPYNGTITTLEALHMGVPVLTLLGDRTASRTSGMLLRALGLDDLVCVDEFCYIERAVALIQDYKRLAAFRCALRDRLAASVLTDGFGLAKALEQGLRDRVLQ